MATTTTLTEDEIQRTKMAVLKYLKDHPFINNTALRELTGLNYDQAIRFFGVMISEGVLRRTGKTSGTKYVLP